MCRNKENINPNGLDILTGAHSYNYAEWIDGTNRVHTSTVSPANNVWHSFMARKTGNVVHVVIERLDNETIVLNQTLSWINIPKTNPTDSIAVLGDYFPNANKRHNIRWTNGMAKDLYLKIL